MDAFALSRWWGFAFTVVGLSVVAASLYSSLHFSLTGLTEMLPGFLTTFLGVHLMTTGHQTTEKRLPDDVSKESGRASPFYYELEPCLTQSRPLPAIPKDIGRVYDPVFMDKF